MKKTSKARGKTRNGSKNGRIKKVEADEQSNKIYRLRLYITGQTPRSLESVRNIRHVCEDYLAGRFELDVVDIYQQPELAREGQVVAAPTLVKRLPLPLRRLVGDLSNQERVLLALNLKDAAAETDATTEV